MIQRIGDRRRPPDSSRKRLRCLRFSRVGRFQRATEPDLLKAAGRQPTSPTSWTALLAKIKVTQTAVGPMPALQAVAHLLGEGDGQRRVVYLVSDFRTEEWNDPTELRKELLKLEAGGAELHLINCVDRSHPNLAIVVADARPKASARPACRGSWKWPCRTSAPNRSGTCTVVLGEDGHGRPAVTLGRDSAGHESPRSVSWCIFPRPARTRSRPAWKATPSTPTTTAIAWSTCRPTCPCCWSMATPEPATPAYLNIALAPGGSVRTGIRPRSKRRAT